MSALTSIRHSIQQVDDMLASLNQKALSDPRPSLLAQVRSLEKEKRSLQVQFEQLAVSEDVRRAAVTDEGSMGRSGSHRRNDSLC